MKILIFMSMLIIMILMILMLLLNILSMKKFYDREKSSPFECGFDAKTSSRLPFSLHFFLIGIIFLIFDVEISLLLPLILMMKISNFLQFNIIMTFFITILLLGLYHEWNQGALTWKN